MKESDQTVTVREAVGVFADAAHVRSAIEDLRASGFGRENVGLLAGEHTVRQALTELYEAVEEPSAHSSEEPKMAFVERESIGDAARSGGGGLFFAGATASAGAVVASAGVLGGALLAAASGVGVVGAIGVGLAMFIRKNEAEYLEEQLAEGRLLLFVRTQDKEEERRASDVLSKHSPLEVRMVTLEQKK